jgi:hypothetical protein
MWGPYDRAAYDRGFTTSVIHEQTLSGTYILAGSLTAKLVYLVTLTGQYVLQGVRVRRRPGKLLRGTIIYAGKIKRHTSKQLRGTYIMSGALAMVKAFKRTLAATYVMQGHMRKRMYVRLLGTMVLAASRLKLQKAWGWEYSGNFEPGDRIKVDSDRLTVMLNGANVLHLVDGPLPFFSPGPNVLTYEDSEGSRQIKIRVLWRGRWV